MYNERKHFFLSTSLLHRLFAKASEWRALGAAVQPGRLPSLRRLVGVCSPLAEGMPFLHSKAPFMLRAALSYKMLFLLIQAHEC